MKDITSKLWSKLFIIFIVIGIGIIAFLVIFVDPYFHFHAPNRHFYYHLENQRSINYGIMKNFDYDGLITGTSMTENFKTSEADVLFNTKFIKVPFSGGSYKEMNDAVTYAISNNPKIKTVIRGIDIGYFFDDKNHMRIDLGTYPTYLYDNNPFNDFNYIFNKDIFKKSLIIIKNFIRKQAGGVQTFDDYSNWMPYYTFGKESVMKDVVFSSLQETKVLTENEIQNIKESAKQNIMSLALENPNITFYYFFTPYSIVWWGQEFYNGNIERQISAEKIYIEEILTVPNIKLYSFNDLFNITTNLNNYKDTTHYGEWINSDILKYMSKGKGLLTPENYKEYLEREYNFYSTYKYSSL